MKWLGEHGVYFRNGCSEEAGVIKNRNQKYKLKCGHFLLTWTVFEMSLLLRAQPLTWGCWWSLFQFQLGVTWVPLGVTGTTENGLRWVLLWKSFGTWRGWEFTPWTDLTDHFVAFLVVFQVRKWWETAAAVTSLSASMNVWRSCHIWIPKRAFPLHFII